MNDPVDNVLAQREALDRGFSGGLLLSGIAHGALVGAALIAAFFAPRRPLLDIAQGFTVIVPRGGQGAPNPPPAAPVASTAPEPAAPPQPEPPREIIKPPQEEPRKGLPELDAKKPGKVKPEPTPPAPRATGPVVAGGTGTSRQQAGLGLELPPGVGVPGGSDTGDYYMAGVQRKIWSIWMQQVKNEFAQPVSVSFTIMADGSVTNVQITRSSGIALLDMAAQRAVQIAGPFSPLPRDYGTSQITVQANFKPTT